jgi:hypothetical protein
VLSRISCVVVVVVDERLGLAVHQATWNCGSVEIMFSSPD